MTEMYASDGWILLYVIFISIKIFKWIPCIDNLLCVKHDIRKLIHINIFNSPNNPLIDEETKLGDVKGLAMAHTTRKWQNKSI